MSFAVAGESYDRLMGRYSRPLAPRFLDFAGVAAGPVVERGCGPGPLTEVLAARAGAAAVAAVDPSEPFEAACRELLGRPAEAFSLSARALAIRGST